MIISQNPPKRHHKKPFYKQTLTYSQILPLHQLEQNPDVLLINQKGIWRNIEYLVKYLLNEQIENSFMNKKIELLFNQTKIHKKERVCNIYFLPACKVIKLKEGDVTLSTSLFMFHLISFSPHLIDHVSFLFPSVHGPSHSFHLPQSISFTFTLFMLYSYYIVIQSYCQFHFSVNLASGN